MLCWTGRYKICLKKVIFIWAKVCGYHGDLRHHIWLWTCEYIDFVLSLLTHRTNIIFKGKTNGNSWKKEQRQLPHNTTMRLQINCPGAGKPANKSILWLLNILIGTITAFHFLLQNMEYILLQKYMGYSFANYYPFLRFFSAVGCNPSVPVRVIQNSISGY